VTLSPWKILIVVAIVVVLFAGNPKQMGKLAFGLGRALRTVNRLKSLLRFPFLR
jgi:Sec-independent protein translocase protein TatA